MVIADSPNTSPSQQVMPVAKAQPLPDDAGSKEEGGGYQKFYNERLYRIFGAVERIGGAAVVPFLMLPFTVVDILRRRHDYPKFVRLREAMPHDFWKGLGPRRHYFRMIRNWQEFLGVVIFYNRLGLPYWRKRFEVQGKSPRELPEWGKRPVILAFMHTGNFGLIRWWMRSQGMPTASLIGAMPAIVDNKDYNKILDAGDRLYGMEGVPHMFRGSGSALREAIRYLKPGRVLTMALDGGAVSPEAERSDAGGFRIDVKKGACRVAAQTGAIVVPISIRRIGICRYRVKFGQPVPDELIQKGDYAGATQHLVTELWPEIKEHPEDLNWTNLEALHPELQVPRIEWP